MRSNLRIALAFIALAGVIVADNSAAQRPPAQVKKLTWRLASSQNPTHPIGQAYKKFADNVSEATRNTSEQIEVLVYPAGQLFAIGQLHAAVTAGQVQLAEIVPSFATGRAPSLSVSDLPFLWPSTQVLWKALDGEYGKLWAGELEKEGKVKNLAFIDVGDVNLFIANRPVRTPADIKGLKLRLPGKYYSLWGKELGVQPVTISGNEALAAIQSGTLDGHITADALYIDRKQYEAAPYVTLFLISTYTYMLGVNQNAWDSLSEDTRQALAKAAKQAQADLRAVMLKTANDYRQQMRSIAKVTELTPKQQADWEATGKPIWDQFLADIPSGRALLNAALAARK